MGKVEKAVKKAGRDIGTFGEKTADVATFGAVSAGKAAKKSAKEQEKLLAAQKAEVEAEEEKRKGRVLRGRQGRRSLLYAGGTAQGIKQTLGE